MAVAASMLFAVPDTLATGSSDLLQPGAQLGPGASLTSRNGEFRLVMQTDGNLVAYNRSSALWATRTHGQQLHAVMKRSGDLVVAEPGGKNVWSSRTSDVDSHLVLQDDGNLVIYSSAGKAVWSTGTDADHGCPRNTADAMAKPGSGGQLITVEASGYHTTYAVLRTWQLVGRCWVAKEGPFVARLGYSGLHDHRQEGDGSTPTGIYALGSTIYGINQSSPNAKFRYHHLVCGDWWDEEPSSPDYNSFQHVPCGTTPSWAAGSEALWTEAPAYDDFAVIDFNTPPHGAIGSAIFLHDNVDGPTAGCVSLPAKALDGVLAWLDPALVPRIAIGTVAEMPHL